jgi:hypothetical protein
MHAIYAFLGHYKKCGHIQKCGIQQRILGAEIKQKRRRKDTYALTGFSCAIFHMKKKPRDSITVKTPSA